MSFHLEYSVDWAAVEISFGEYSLIVGVGIE